MLGCGAKLGIIEDLCDFVYDIIMSYYLMIYFTMLHLSDRSYNSIITVNRALSWGVHGDLPPNFMALNVHPTLVV